MRLKPLTILCGEPLSMPRSPTMQQRAQFECLGSLSRLGNTQNIFKNFSRVFSSVIRTQISPARFVALLDSSAQYWQNKRFTERSANSRSPCCRSGRIFVETNTVRSCVLQSWKKVSRCQLQPHAEVSEHKVRDTCFECAVIDRWLRHHISR